MPPRTLLRHVSCFAAVRTQLPALTLAAIPAPPQVNHGFDVGRISGALPPNLQNELLLHLHAPLVRSVPMFEQCAEAFIRAIVLQLRPQVLLGGDAVFKEQEVGTEMYFISRGEMRMMDSTLTVCYNTLYSVPSFGSVPTPQVYARLCNPCARGVSNAAAAHPI